MSQQVIGVIGGSGLYDIEGLQNVETVQLDTPFGAPSDAYVTGTLAGRKLVFLPRHGRGHKLLPSELNFRANIWGFVKLGVRWLISVSAVGSMREEIAPGHMVMVDQFYDRTKSRASSFFGDGIVGHVPFGDPICADLSGLLYDGAVALGLTAHKGGTYICIEGPQFSTRAESNIYRSWGVDVIGMTNIPEAKLAREAGLCYATIAMATDYDCWHDGHDDVSVETVMKTLQDNVDNARRLIAHVAETFPAELDCRYSGTTRAAIMTAPENWPADARARLALLLGEEGTQA
ncbi:MAG: S-methyl-5'-thioadenosine phosphorylase [Myxococcales bacterium]|nr:S-methyl-5'-thioadenosine phosphorylase [Myxococcales bacterium]